MPTDIQIYELPAKASLATTDMLAVDDATVSHETSKVDGQQIVDLVIANVTTDDIVEGSTNFYYTDARARAALSGGDGITYDSATGDFDVDFNSTNLKITANQIDTIQGISTAASPQFTGLNLSGITASRLLATDSLKNVSVASGTYNISINGNAGSSTNADRPYTEATNDNNEYLPTFVIFTTNGYQDLKFDLNYRYNPSTNTLTVPTFAGALSGNATTATSATSAATLTTPRTIGGVSFDGSANIVPQTIQSVNEASDTTCFPLFISASGSQSLQPLNNAGFIYNSSANSLTATTFIGALTGNSTTATTATNATNVATTSTTTATATWYPLYVTSSTTGNQAARMSSFFNVQFQLNNFVRVDVDASSVTNGQAILGIARNGTSSYAQFFHSTNSTLNWATGLRTGDGSYHIFDAVNSVDTVVITPGSGVTSVSTFSGDVTANGNLILNTAGKTLKIKEGSNACKGTGAVMVAGAVTVSTTAAATGNQIVITKTAAGGTPTVGVPTVTISNGTSFTITGDTTDTSTWSWMIIKQA